MHRVRVLPRKSRAALFLLTALAVACSDETPTTPTTPVVTTTDVFIGAVPIGETRFHSFAVTGSGTAEITLGSLTLNGQLVTTSVTLAIGTPAEDGCTVITSVTARPALSANLSYAVTAGNYCVSVTDTNTTLAGTAQYSVRVVRP